MSKSRLGVVIFNDDFFSDEGLAALKWAHDFLRQSHKLVRILLVKDVNGQSTQSADLKRDDLRYLVNQKGQNNNSKDDWMKKLEDYIDNFVTEKKFLGKSYGSGSSIDEILKEAIEGFKLDTLVLGMAAVGKTATRRIDLQLNSKCCVVLAKIKDPKPLKLKTTLEISDAPADGDVTQVNAAEPVSNAHQIEPSTEQDQQGTS